MIFATSAWLSFVILWAVSGAALEDTLSGGVLVTGADRALIELPAGVRIEPYSNDGYRLTVTEAAERRALVEVEVQPLGVSMLFDGAGTSESDEPLGRLGQRLTRASRTRYDASSALLGWIARNVRYELDRSQSQRAVDVLQRRTGYCTGIAALAVDLHLAVGIPAREVPGLVFDDAVTPGYHRWVEVELAPGRWVFSDPLRFHHFVPARFVPLATDQVSNPHPAVQRRILEQDDRIEALDLLPGAPSGVARRPAHQRRRFGALRVALSSSSVVAVSGLGEEGERARRSGSVSGRRLVLSGPRWKRSRELSWLQGYQSPDVAEVFVGLTPGEYQLWLEERRDERLSPETSSDQPVWRQVGERRRITMEGADLIEVQWP